MSITKVVDDDNENDVEPNIVVTTSTEEIDTDHNATTVEPKATATCNTLTTESSCIGTSSSTNHHVVVSTKYGNGCILQHRSDDQIIEIQLQNGARLYAPSDSVIPTPRTSSSRTVMTTTNTHDDTLDVSRQSSCCSNEDDRHDDQSVMELNVAYESLETMRKLNLEMTCQEHHIPYTLQDLQTTCAVCLLAREPYVIPPTNTTSETAPTEPPKRSFFSKSKSTTTPPPSQASISQALIAKKYSKVKISPPCLICGTPTCPKHGSVSFRKENIIMCLTCEELFGLSYVTQILTCPTPQGRRQSIDKMIELYDRTVLLLRFLTTTVPFDHVCTVVQQSTVRKNKIGIGSSTAGMVSGVLGIVSAATIFTPIGPPLLIASLVFGGSATAAQTGSHIRNSAICSEPHRIADRIIALHGICWNILRVTGTLRDALLLDHLRTDLYTLDDNGHGVQHIMLTGTSQISTSPINEYYRTHQNEVLAKASNLGSIGTVGVVGFTAATMEIGGAAAAVESGVVAARGATFFSRGGTAAAALNALQFARFAGGALSAATLLFEAHNLKNTIHAIQCGNPCDKVDTIKRIRDQIRDIPSTQAVDAECERYLQALTRRQRVLTEQEVTNLLLETNEIIQEVQEIAAQASNHSENDEKDDSENNILDASERSRESIRRRLTMYQRGNSTSSSLTDERDEFTGTASSSRPILSLRERIQLHKRQEKRPNSPSTIRECNNEFDDDDARHAENLIC